MMKTIYLLLFAITMAFLVSQAEGVEWVSMGTDKWGDELSYDRETLTKLPTGIIKVWKKTKYSEEGRKAFIQEYVIDEPSVNRYEALSRSLFLWEINCATRDAKVTEFAFQSSDGEVLDSSYAPKEQSSEKWYPVSPESEAEKLYKAVCPPQEKK
jgi:hypothetical protein